MLTNKRYLDTCWWCGKEATTSEHVFKKTDFENVFGPPPNNVKNLIVFGHHKYDGKIVQGSNSKFIKFNKNLCKDCNSNKSQPFDRAYSLFSKYVIDNVDDLIVKKEIDFRDIFQDDWQINKHNTFKYLIKHICCRLANSTIKIPEDCINYLNGLIAYANVHLNLKISIPLLKLYLDMEKDKCEGFLSVGEIHSNSIENQNSISSTYVVNYFAVQYFVSDYFVQQMLETTKYNYSSPIWMIDLHEENI